MKGDKTMSKPEMNTAGQERAEIVLKEWQDAEKNTMSKSDKDYVYDRLVDAQGIIDDLVEYMEDDDTYEEENRGGVIACIVIILLLMGVFSGVLLQAMFGLL